MTNHVFQRVPAKELPVAEAGQGAFIVDGKGRRYLDASGGAVVVNLGHGREEIAQAIGEQLLRGYYFHPTMFATDAVAKLADKLAGHAPKGISRFYFMTSGSEAVETAIKLARQIHVAGGQESRYKLISRWRSYHGLTLGALAATGRTSLRAPFLPMLLDGLHIAPPYCLRCAFGLEPSSCALRCATALDEIIVDQGPKTISAFIGETVSGASLAICPPPPGYWPLVQEICNHHGVLLIQDEVMCGMGRTGKWFASEHYEAVPDIVTLGKGLSGGALPLSAVGVTEELYQVLAENGGFVHGGTFSHHPVCAAAGLAAVGILEQERLVERVEVLGPVLGEKLTGVLGDSPYVGDIRGLGMMWGLELVADKATLSPFPRARKVAELMWEHLFKQGVIVYKALALAGTDGDGLVVAPPFIISENEMDIVTAALRRALDEVLKN
ncbi:MAG: aspartate aminotransferase family protein [Desulfobacterales bacterium]